jgi:hypothetical protein
MADLPVRTVDKAAHNAGNSTLAAAATQVRGNTRDKAIVGISLASVPDHDTTKARESSGVLKNRLQGRGREVSGSGSTGVTGNTNKDLDVGVGGRVLGPGVPGLEVVVLGAGAGDVVVDSAVVVVELDPDGVEFNGAVEHLVIGGVGVDTLWGGGQVVFLFTS